MSECEANKGLVVQALRSYGSVESTDLAKCIEDGKVHIGGCIPINERVNEVLETILRKETSHVINHEVARIVFEKMEFAIKAGRKASKRYEICTREFNTDLQMAVTDIHTFASHKGPSLVEIAEMKVQQARQRLEWAESDLSRKRNRR